MGDARNRAWLARAAEIAERGRGEVEPNPRVGALAIAGDEVVGLGHHAFYGGPHAEEEALRAAREAGREPDGIVVSLEPCSSERKKRPPCTRLLVDAGIGRVVVGCADPDPRHAGRGIELLRGEGLEVEGPYEDAASAALLGRFRRALGLGRPWVLAKWAMTLDGKTATRTGSSRWISGDAALDWAHRLRARSDAVCVGIGTALADDPALDVRRVEGPSPRRIVVDPEAALGPDARLFGAGERSAVECWIGEGVPAEAAAALESRGARLRRLAPTRAGGHRGLRVEPALRALHAEGLRRVLVEGGGGLLASLLAQRLVDQVVAYAAPKLCGGRAAKSPLAGEGVARMDDALVLDEPYAHALGEGFVLGGFVGEVG